MFPVCMKNGQWSGLEEKSGRSSIAWFRQFLCFLHSIHVFQVMIRPKSLQTIRETHWTQPTSKGMRSFPCPGVHSRCRPIAFSFSSKTPHGIVLGGNHNDMEPYPRKRRREFDSTIAQPVRKYKGGTLFGHNGRKRILPYCLANSQIPVDLTPSLLRSSCWRHFSSLHQPTWNPSSDSYLFLLVLCR